MYDFIPQFLPNLTTPALNTFPSMLWMLPRTNLSGINIWKENFIQTPTQNFNINNLEKDFMKVLNSPVFDKSYHEVEEATKYSAEDPNVNKYIKKCFNFLKYV